MTRVRRLAGSVMDYAKKQLAQPVPRIGLILTALGLVVLALTGLPGLVFLGVGLVLVPARWVPAFAMWSWDQIHAARESAKLNATKISGSLERPSASVPSQPSSGFFRLTQRKITLGNMMLGDEELVWDPREETLRLKKLVKDGRWKMRPETRTVKLDETFDAALVEHGTLHSKPSGTNALIGAALSAPLPGSAAVGAIIGGSVHDVDDSRIGYVEIKGDGFHKVVKVNPKHDKKAIVKAANIVIGIKQAVIELTKEA